MRKGCGGDHRPHCTSCTHSTAAEPQLPLPASPAAWLDLALLPSGRNVPSDFFKQNFSSWLQLVPGKGCWGLTCSRGEGDWPGATRVHRGQRWHVGRRGPGLDLHFHRRSGHHWHPLLTSNCRDRRWEHLVRVMDKHLLTQHSCKGEDRINPRTAEVGKDL